jgi:MOSC domain-containing protein YiiM
VVADATLHSIHVSDGGVPKVARSSAYVGAGGVEGDRQRDLRYHGGPDRAVCLYSLELIEALRAEGHPIAPGAIGENLTLAGVDWGAMVPGARLEVGEALLEITSYTSPCRNIRRSFRGEDFGRVSQRSNPGWSRVYARVVREGRVAVGDPALLRTPGVE